MTTLATGMVLFAFDRTRVRGDMVEPRGKQQRRVQRLLHAV